MGNVYQFRPIKTETETDEELLARIKKIEIALERVSELMSKYKEQQARRK